MRPVLCQTELYCQTEVVGFEPTDALRYIGGLAIHCIRPLCHTSNGNNWTRTSGLSIISRMLYQLSYVSLVFLTGFEPVLQP